MFVTMLENPRTGYRDVSLQIDYKPKDNEPITIRFELTSGNPYEASLTWQDWIKMDTWVREQLLSGTR